MFSSTHGNSCGEWVTRARILEERLTGPTFLANLRTCRSQLRLQSRRDIHLTYDYSDDGDVYSHILMTVMVDVNQRLSSGAAAKPKAWPTIAALKFQVILARSLAIQKNNNELRVALRDFWQALLSVTDQSQKDKREQDVVNKVAKQLGQGVEQLTATLHVLDYSQSAIDGASSNVADTQQSLISAHKVIGILTKMLSYEYCTKYLCLAVVVTSVYVITRRLYILTGLTMVYWLISRPIIWPYNVLRALLE